MAAAADQRQVPQPAHRSVVDLHCHTSASFDSLSDPLRVVRAAAARGLTHIAITDHDRVDGAQRARDAQIPGITVIVGSEVRTREGDLIALFVERPIEAGLPAVEAIAAIRAQGGAVGIPHPFDSWRGSLLRSDAALALVDQIDWIEGWNARLVAPGGNARAAALAVERGVPSVAVSDAHTILEVGGASTVLLGSIATTAELLVALRGEVRTINGRGAAVARLVTPVAKLVNAARGNRRVHAGATFSR